MLKTVSAVVNAIGALNYKGTWNATTNTPALASGVGTKGDYYVVSVAGTTTLDGISNWGVGDWVAFNGSAWQRVEGGADLNGVNLSVSGTSTLGDNATFSTAGKGVNFSANANAPGMTSESLAWYEEGTFTPTIVGTGGAGLGTYTTQVGRYTRIGRQVTVQIELGWSAHTGLGDMFIAGLPFTCSAVRSAISAISYDMTLAANCSLGGRVTASGTTIELLNQPTAGGAWSGVAMDTSVVALVVTATYTV